jgi:hypothetical protein
LLPWFSCLIEGLRSCGVVQLMLLTAAGYVSLHFGSSPVPCLMAFGLSICGAHCECFVLSRDRLGAENDIPLVCVVVGIQ